MLNLLKLSSATFSVADLLFSRTAILAYILLLVGIIATVVIFVMINENKKKDNAQYRIVGTSGVSNHPHPESESRFCMLSEIDKKKNEYKRSGYDDEITLREMCEDFRNYMARELELYYEIDDIRKFIAGLSV